MLNEKYTKFANMKEGMRYYQPVLVVAMEEGVARTGNSFVKFKLSDGDMTVQANVFEATLDSMYADGIREGTVINVDMSIKEPYYNISSVSVNVDDNVSVNDFVRSVPLDPQEMLDEIGNMIADSCVPGDEGDRNLWFLADNILFKNEEAFKTSSAAKTIHHACRSGLIYHSYRMAKAAMKLADTYECLDRTLLVVGAALHDIGKIRELSTNEFGEATYTPEGRLLGHAMLGVEIVDEIAESFHYSCEKVEMLKHIIASHHGKLEYGACVVPAIPEAVCVSMLDNLDAKLYQLEDALKSTEPGELSKKVFGLENCTAYRKKSA